MTENRLIVDATTWRQTVARRSVQGIETAELAADSAGASPAVTAPFDLILAGADIPGGTIARAVTD